MAVSFVLLISALFTVGRKSNATFVDNAISIVVTPLQDLSTSIGGWVSERVNNVLHKTDLAKENKELKEAIAQLEAENKRLLLFEDENKKLSDLLKIEQKYPDYDTTGAQIIAKDPGNWYDIFVIDKGKRDGIDANMTLTNAGGLIGKVIESGSGYAKAQSILDSRSSVSAISLRTNDLGVVKGEYSLMDAGLCRMEYVNADAEIMVGDEIVTSHLSQIYPPGITIGHVKEIRTEANGLTKYAIIEPTVDFKHLDTVVVINQVIDKGSIQTQITEEPEDIITPPGVIINDPEDAINTEEQENTPTEEAPQSTP